jgi:peptide/nickel transport system substrate-binding protein
MNDLQIHYSSPIGYGFIPYYGAMSCPDKYTLEIEWSDQLEVSWHYNGGIENRMQQQPPELWEAGADVWMNHVGTGPWKLDEYVIGSHMSYSKNPMYHETTIIDGVEYEIPFVEYLMRPIIPDKATQMAALRTGQIDWHQSVLPDQWATLEETAPGLNIIPRATTGATCLSLLLDNPIFDDINVRRAIMIGLDLTAFTELHGLGPLPIHFWPLCPANPDVYIPLDEMPAAVQELYTHDVDKALDMLDTAGYGEGFEMEYIASSSPAMQDVASLLAYQLDQLGITVNIRTVDLQTLYSIQDDRSYTDSIEYGINSGQPFELFLHGRWDNPVNVSNWKNTRYDELMTIIGTTIDPIERIPYIQEACSLFITDMAYIPLYPSVYGFAWWPWIKNYYSEYCVTEAESDPVWARMWLDEDLKDDMGY